MPLAFLLDEHLRGRRLGHAIRQHNTRGADPIDVIRVGDPPDLPLGSTDPAVLLWAERAGRILVTLDRHTLPGHLADHLRAGHQSPGVLLVRRHASLSQIVSYLALIAHVGDPSDFLDRLEYIP